MPKPKKLKLNTRINVYEGNRLLPHCPMKVTKIEKNVQRKNWATILAIDAVGNARIIRHHYFRIDIV